MSNSNLIFVNNSIDITNEDSINRSSQNQALLKQMQKKYSKSVDCYHYTDCNNHVNVPVSPNNANDARINNIITPPPNTTTSTSTTNASTTNNNSKKVDEPNNQVKNNVEINNNANSYNNNNIQLQRQYSQTNSPLIPRRNDYEPMTRVTIQRQQRVCDLSPTKSTNTPLTNSTRNIYSDDYDESTTYTNTLTQSKFFFKDK